MAKIPTKKQTEEVAGILKTLSHPQRLMILCQLSEGRRSVGELETLSGASQSSVSQFLARMKAEGLVHATRENQMIFYEVANPKILKLIQSMSKIFC